MSSGVAHRFMGTRPSSPSSIDGSARANSVRSVATQPGTRAFTRTPAYAHSTASDRVSDSTAAFAAP